MFVGIHIYAHIHECLYIDCPPQSSLNNIALLWNTADTYIYMYKYTYIYYMYLFISYIYIYTAYIYICVCMYTYTHADI